MKSAFLIVAHGNFDMLKLLIRALDYKNNDLFIHIDRKCGKVDYSEFERITKYSKVECLRNRISVSWGGVSQVKATFLLLKKAMCGQYGYYHLISGVDFPLLTNEELEKFLIMHKGREFVGFTQNDEDLRYKLGYYHFFNDGILKKIPHAHFLDNLFVAIQKKLHIRNVSDLKNMKKGCNWWTITDELATSLLKEENRILRRYRFSLCSDEVFLQTFIWEQKKMIENVYQIDNEYESCMRLIDWNRGKPYVFKESDFVELMNCKRFFARKFGDIKVVEKFIKFKQKGLC